MRKKLISLLLAATMITSMFNTVALATDVEEQKTEETQIVCEMCGHEHNEDCGYAAAVEGQPCTHQHSEDCGYEAGIDGTPCSHEHTEECYKMVTNCTHEHTDECYPVADSDTEATVPDDVSSDGTELQIDDRFLIATPSEPTECTHVCTLDNGCVIKELNCTHEHNTDECGYTASTEGVPCNHEHTAECGFVAAVAGSPCQHECITPMTAIAQTNDVYEVSSAAEYATVLEQIANADAPSATIVLKTNLGDNARRTPTTKAEKELVGGENPEKAKIIGVVGKHITLKSDGDAHYTVALGDCYLVGDVTFDNVEVSGSRIYANGFTLEFTENAEGGVTVSIFGGSNRRPVENTHLILNGGTFGNGRQTVMIYGGGSSDGVGDSGGPSMSVDGNPSMPGYVPPAFNPGQGDVHGDVTIEIGEAKFENGMAAIIGGGINANVGGDVSITVDSVADFYHNFESITGAGESNRDGYGHVLGDVTIHANSGMVQYIYGTGWPGGAYGSNVEAGKRRSVGGNVTITAGTESGPTMRILGFSNTASIIGCGNAEDVGYTSTSGAAVGGDVHITLGKSAHFESFDSARKSAMEGVGINSVCYGTVTLINNGATYANELGIFACYQGGKILNQEEEKNAATIIQNSGKLKHIEPVGTFGITYPAEIKGDVSIEVNGGELTSVYGRQGENELEIDGNFNVLVTGGKLQYVFGTTVGREMTEGHISTLTFDGFSGNWLYYLGYLDDVNVTNSSTVRLTGATSYEPFYLRTVKNLTVESGSVLGLSKSGSLTGDLTVNGTLALTRTDNTTDKTKPGTIATLSADGTATGTGSLKPVNADWFKTFLMDSAPVYLEEYVYADTDGSNLELTLEPAVTGLFANRKNHTENARDVWFIDQGEPAEKITVTYQWKGGDSSKNIPSDVTLPEPEAIEKGSAYTAKQVTSTTHTFDGWYLDEAYTQKFTNGTVLDADTTLYGNWRVGTDKILWYRNIYLQNADGKYPDEPGSHGQGGWADPDSPLTISGSDFDGTQVEGYTLGKEFVYDANYKDERLYVAAALEAGKHNPLRVYYKRAPHTVTYEYEGTIPENAPEVPEQVDTWFGAEVSVAAAPSMGGWVFSGWTVKTPEETTTENGKLTMPNADVVLKGSWQKATTPIDPKAAVYKIEHYKQQADGSYKLEETEFPLYDEIGKIVSAVPKSYVGYSVNAEKSTMSGEVIKPIVENGEAKYLILTVYYDTDGGGGTDPTPDPTYTVSYDANGGSGTAPASPTEYKENATVTVLTNTFTNGSKSFIGWKDGDGKSYSAGTTFSMPAKNVVLYAQWKSNNPGGGGGDTTDYTSLTVTKVWENDKAENRPTSIAAQLYRNGTAYGKSVELNEQNSWTYTWRSLDDSYTWTVDETSVPQGYEKTVTGSGTKYTITNKRTEDKPIEPGNPVEPSEPEKPITPPTEPSSPNQPTKPDKLPQTNDTSAMGLWLIMSILSGLGLILLNVKKRRKTDTE